MDASETAHDHPKIGSRVNRWSGTTSVTQHGKSALNRIYSDTD